MSRQHRFLPTLAVVALLAAPLHPQAGDEPSESDFLSRVRRLTYEGLRAGEGYFSSDGGKMVFQSERSPENPFYQIFELDLTSGDTRRISPGYGKTTCAFLQEGTGDILFSSTHHDPRSLEYQRQELEARASGQERRYGWDYDPEMEIFVADSESLELTRLTNGRGYDAEASFSPDGQWIVFGSMRDAYNRELSAEEEKILGNDPSYFGEIYIMKSDGSEQTRLTEVPGYDGGPFFTPDGERVVWRRFTEDGLMADVWTMRPDGSDQTRLTDFGAMSWAPYMHPSGEYVFFASNKLGFSNFEIFIVDSAGRKEPVRATYTEGFDGLPVPTPDGQGLAWTSTRHGGDGGQIYLASWNHERALATLEVAPPRHSSAPALPAALEAASSSESLARDIGYLASEELGGRLTGSDGARKAADFLAARLVEMGALPLPGQDSVLVPFEFTAGVRDSGSVLRLTDSAGGEVAEWTAGEDLQALSFSESDEVSGEVVFAGYGLVIPEKEGFSYDSYFGLDIEDKIVVVLRYFPEDAEQTTRAILSRYAGLRYKALYARERGAKALIVVTGPRSPNAGKLVTMTFDTAVAGSGLVAASVTGTVAERLFSGLDESLERSLERSLEEVQAALDTANPHETGFELAGITLELATEVERQRRTGRNVVAYFPATTGASVERPWLLLGAHYDHLGTGSHGNSLARKGEAGTVHPGADDNASGVVGILAVAARLAEVDRQRAVVVALWSGEELGLLGSAAFVQQEILAPGELAAYLNFDMVGRMRDNKLVVQAVGSSSLWPLLLEETNVVVGFDLQIQEDPYLPTDTWSFNQAQVPTLNLFTGSHEDYHRPSDSAAKINYEDLDRVVNFTTILAKKLLQTDQAPEFVKVETRVQAAGRDGVRAFTGTIPDYTSESEGLLLSGVVGGGPADQAGLREGDVIVRFGSQEITNIYDYTYALDAVKVDEPLEVVFLRDGERRTTTMVPTARQ